MTESKFWQDESAHKTAKWQPGLSTTILLLLTGVALLTSLLSALINQDASETWWSGFLQNFSTEMMGAIITFGLFELILNRRKEIDEKTSLESRQKRRLQILAGSRNNSVAVGALDELRAEGWFNLLENDDVELVGANWMDAYLPEVNLHGKDMHKINMERINLRGGNLQRCNLKQANLKAATLLQCNMSHSNLSVSNLSKAELSGANLNQVRLERSNLENAYLGRTSLKNADLEGANLSMAKLERANLENAYLGDTNLMGVYASGANLAGVNLRNTNLRNAQFFSGGSATRVVAVFTRETILPDGTKYDLDKGIGQMERFTNSDHPDFWQPDWVKVWNETGELPGRFKRWYRDSE